MHTKEELTKKKAQSSEQLDLVDAITSDDRVHQKRKFLLIAIFATIGLSLIFWVYRAVSSVSFSLPAMPSLPLNKIVAPNLNTKVAEILGKEASKWQVDVTQDSKITADLSRLKVSKNSLVQEFLPEGIEIKESVLTTSTDQSINILITVPQKRIYMAIKCVDTDFGKFKLTLSKLVPAIYWSTIESATN